MRHGARSPATGVLLTLWVAMAAPACREPDRAPAPKAASPSERAAFPGDGWQSGAIAYSGYREGQHPRGGPRPSPDQVAEDLRILARHWRFIRMYSADGHAEDALEVIRREKLDLSVMLGIWLAREPGAEASNAQQIAEGIRLARAYEDLVVAVNVGNEVLIEWTHHPVPEERVLRYVREVKAGVSQPVTVADNYVWWRDHGAALAREVDFITMHTYPLWERKDIDEGMSYTIANYEEVRAAHPGRAIVIGEAGWATYTEGNLHVPRGGDEVKQQRYHEEVSDWARKNRVLVFFFEAFDEPWKGTGTEGHWGFFSVDRKAKRVMRERYPDLTTEGPTSPTYPERIAPSGPDLAVPLRAEFARAVPNGNVNVDGPGVSSSGVVSDAGAEGGSALRLAFTGESWGGLYFMLGTYDASAAAALTMRLRLSDEVGRLELKLVGPESSAQSVDLLDHPAVRDEAGWRTFSVPMTAFERLDRSRIEIVGLWNPSDENGAFVPCELVVDDLRFE